jgi:hypothetical protein
MVLPLDDVADEQPYGVGADVDGGVFEVAFDRAKVLWACKLSLANRPTEGSRAVREVNRTKVQEQVLSFYWDLSYPGVLGSDSK